MAIQWTHVGDHMVRSGLKLPELRLNWHKVEQYLNYDT